MTDFEMHDSGTRQSFDTGAVRDIQEGKGRFDLISPIALRRLAKVMEKGAGKYGDRNWELGIPMQRCMDSALRHLTDYLEGKRDEDHLAQAAFNVFAMIHTEEMVQRGNLPGHMNDMPSYMEPPLDKDWRAPTEAPPPRDRSLMTATDKVRDSELFGIPSEDQHKDLCSTSLVSESEYIDQSLIRWPSEKACSDWWKDRKPGSVIPVTMKNGNLHYDPGTPSGSEDDGPIHSLGVKWNSKKDLRSFLESKRRKPLDHCERNCLCERRGFDVT